MDGYRIVSSDDHVFEPADLWTSRIESRYRERAPQVLREEDGADWWYCDGLKGMNVGIGQVGVRFEDPDNLTLGDTMDSVRPGGYIPEEHIKDLEIDGVYASITYPTVGLLLYKVPDRELLNSVFRVYNDWLAEFCAPFPQRIKGIAMINLDNVGEAIEELERCAKMGLVGAMIPVYPQPNRTYDSPEYEPFWAAAQDLQIPLSLHTATNRPSVEEAKALEQEPMVAAFLVNMDYWVRMSLTHMIYSGVFERYPKLAVGSIEHELSWVPHFLERLDHMYNQRPREVAPYRFKENMIPSDFFHDNVFLSFQEDPLGMQMRHIIGVDKLLWGSDYPHVESTFPKSQEILGEILADCTEEEKAKIAGGNAARVYNLN